MLLQFSIREINQHFSHYIKSVEEGNELIITRRGKAIAKMIPIIEYNDLAPAQIMAKTRLLSKFQTGYSLKNEKLDRDSLHER